MWSRGSPLRHGRPRTYLCEYLYYAEHSTLIEKQHDDKLVKDYGVGLAVDIIRKITSTGKIQGIHLCTLNLEKSVQLVIEKLQWAGGSPEMKNRLIAASFVHLMLEVKLLILVLGCTRTDDSCAALYTLRLGHRSHYSDKHCGKCTNI